MRTVRAIAAATIIGAGLTLAAAAPAQATPVGPAAGVEAAASSPVTGQSGSAPAYPVSCEEAGGQISCTPDSTADVKAQTCFLGVLFEGNRTTVCTTYEGHAAAIQAAGGKPTLVQYGCSAGDLVCVTFENAGRGMALSATGMMFAIVSNMRFDTSSVLWSAAVEEWSFWQWAILMVLLGSMIWAIAAAVVSGDRSQLIGALVRAFIAVPAVPLTLWVTGHLLNAVDDMTWYIMNRDGPNGLFMTLQGVMWAVGQANYFFAFILHSLLTIGMLLLMLVFTFRNIVLAALIAVGPVAWMLFPLRGIGPQWVVRYVSAVVVLLLTGPLTIGFVTLIINGLSTVSTIWDPQSWPLLAGLVLVAFAPFALFGLFSFVGAVAADSVTSAAGGRAAATGTRAARTAVAIPSRLGGSPASAAKGRPGTATTGRPASPGGSGRGFAGVRGASAPAAKTPAPSAAKPSAAPAGAAAQPTSSPAPAGAPKTERSGS